MSKPKKLTRFDVLAMLGEQIKYAGSLRKYAKEIGVSAAYVSDVMRGRRDPGPTILDELMLRKVVTPAVVRYVEDE